MSADDASGNRRDSADVTKRDSKAVADVQGDDVQGDDVKVGDSDGLDVRTELQASDPVPDEAVRKADAAGKQQPIASELNKEKPE